MSSTLSTKNGTAVTEHEVDHLAVMHIDLSISRQPQSYQSIRCAVSMPVFLRPGDNPEDELKYYLTKAREQLHEEINQEFENHDEPAPYGDEPRWKLIGAPQDKGLYAIVPDSLDVRRTDGWVTHIYGGHRREHLAKMLLNDYSDQVTDLIDVSAGDDLPELDTRYLVRSHRQKFQFLSPVHEQKLPELKEKYGPLVSSFLAARPEIMPEVIEGHLYEYPLFDCLDGDYSKLPEPVEEEEEIPFGEPLDEYTDDYEDLD